MKWAKRDRYGRIVGFVIVDGQDMNLAQVKADSGSSYQQPTRAPGHAKTTASGRA